MPGKAVISLTTGLEDPEKVTVALLVAVGAAESGRPTVIFLAKEAVRLAVQGIAVGVACDGRPIAPEQVRQRRALLRLPHLLQRQGARPRRPGRTRRAGRHRAALGVDRRRRHDLQLLTPVGRPGLDPGTLGLKVPCSPG